MNTKVQRALLSVWDKAGLVDLARVCEEDAPVGEHLAASALEAKTIGSIDPPREPVREHVDQRDLSNGECAHADARAK